MTEPAASQPDQSTESALSITNVSGGVTMTDAQVDVGGDVVGRDKLVSTIYHIEHATFEAPAPDVAGRGLSALHDLMQRSAEVRRAVVAFQTDFGAAHQQLDAVADYKDLHDQLHQLQFHCYVPLVQEAPRFPTDDHALDILTASLMDLEGIAIQLNQVVSRSSLPKRETDWIGEVSVAQTNWHTAIDQLDSSQLRRVINRLRSLLAIQPSRINARLNQAAGSLRLQALVVALSQVSNHLQSLQLDADQVSQFQSGLAALSQLEQNLTALVDDHDRWQEIEVELWRLEGSLAQDASELELTWPDLKVKSDALCGATGVEWAATLRKEGESLTAALAGGNPVAIKRAFTGYRRRASNRFFQVDADLKSLCGELRKVGAPLSTVLRMME